MTYSVQPVTLADASGLASVMTGSRWCDPHWKALFEESTSSDQVRDECAERLPWNLINGRGAKRHQKAIDIDTGTVVAYARWILPDHLTKLKDNKTVWDVAQVADVNAEQRQLWKEKFDKATDNGQIRHLRRDLLTFRSTPLEVADERLTKDKQYLTLDYLSTAPEYQRRGIGAQMLQSGLQIADTYGLDIFVTASPAGLKLYLSHGFKIVETISVDYSKFGGTEDTVNHFMVRPSSRCKA